MSDTTLHRFAVTCLVAFVAVTMAEHLLVPQLNPLTHQVSEYANGPYAVTMTAGLMSWSALCALSAWLLARRRQRTLGILLAIAALGLALTAKFPTETIAGELPRGRRLHLSGQMHDLGSGLASLALLIAALVSIRGLPALRRWTVPLLAVLAVVVPVLVAVGPAVGGLRQRIIIAGGCSWQLALLVVIRPRQPASSAKPYGR